MSILSSLFPGKNPPAEATAAQYPHAEQDLATELGLTHATLKDTRREVLRRGEDWELVKNRVHYTAAGKAKVLAALKIAEPAGPPAAAPAPDSAPNGPPRIPGATAVLVCVKACYPNRRMVTAVLAPNTPLPAAAGPGVVPGSAAQTGATQRVRVRDNRNFTAGMAMQCRFVQDNLWDLAQRLPRWRGRW